MAVSNLNTTRLSRTSTARLLNLYFKYPLLIYSCPILIFKDYVGEPEYAHVLAASTQEEENVPFVIHR